MQMTRGGRAGSTATSSLSSRVNFLKPERFWTAIRINLTGFRTQMSVCRRLKPNSALRRARAEAFARLPARTEVGKLLMAWVALALPLVLQLLVQAESAL